MSASAPSPSSPPTSSPQSAAVPVAWSDPQRQALFAQWLSSLSETWALQPHSLRPASADASFRRYLRIDSQHPAHASCIIMDAPPAHENCQPFVDVARLMAQAGVVVPEVLAWDAANGFMLLSDLGNETLMHAIQTRARSDDTPPLDWFLQAVDALVRWQSASRPGVLPAYDEALLRRELGLFPQWYIAQHRQYTLSSAQQQTLDAAFTSIVQHNLRAPSVYVHRDFMPRNLMRLASAADQPAALGVLDFQDAVYGPITYDIACLMRDAFWSWDEAFCLDVTVRYWERARAAGLPVDADFGEFYRGVEWMGLQRHLKVAGIFARLTLRDGKPHYLADAPRFIGYIRATCNRYRELGPLLRLIDTIENIPADSTWVMGRG